MTLCYEDLNKFIKDRKTLINVLFVFLVVRIKQRERERERGPHPDVNVLFLPLSACLE